MPRSWHELPGESLDTWFGADWRPRDLRADIYHRTDFWFRFFSGARIVVRMIQNESACPRMYPPRLPTNPGRISMSFRISAEHPRSSAAIAVMSVIMSMALTGCGALHPRVAAQKLSMANPAPGTIAVEVAPSPDDDFMSAEEYRAPLAESVTVSGLFAQGVGEGGASLKVTLRKVSYSQGYWSIATGTGLVETTWVVVKNGNHHTKEFVGTVENSAFNGNTRVREAIEKSAAVTIKAGLEWLATLP